MSKYKRLPRWQLDDDYFESMQQYIEDVLAGDWDGYQLDELLAACASRIGASALEATPGGVNRDTIDMRKLYVVTGTRSPKWEGQVVRPVKRNPVNLQCVGVGGNYDGRSLRVRYSLLVVKP